MHNHYKKKQQFPRISLLENAKYYLEKAGEIIKRHKNVDDMDFLISDNLRMIAKPSDRSMKCPAKVDSSIFQYIAAYDVHTFIRFRLIDDPESIKLTLIATDITLKQTVIYSRQLNSTVISEDVIDDSYFWWKLDRASEKDDLDTNELKKLNPLCICGTCARCIWRSTISKYPISKDDISKVTKALEECSSVDDFLRFMDQQE
ncbi:MAG: hypothetical protein JNL74_20035 [Fibrobacteres bacterium]|nr:hypothetical protein [Fibrobacterota bacterium]